MELKEFISATLVEIVEAVYLANTKLTNRDAVVSPSIRFGDGIPNDCGAFPFVERVEFNVALTVSDQKSSGVGAGINVLGASIGGSGKDITESQSINKIKFSVPIIFPQNKFTRPESWREEKPTKIVHNQSPAI